MGSAQNLEYFEDLVDFTVAHEERFLLGHLCKNASSRPEVNSERVVFLTEENFRAPVPESDDLMSIRLDWESEGSG